MKKSRARFDILMTLKKINREVRKVTRQTTVFQRTFFHKKDRVD